MKRANAVRMQREWVAQRDALAIVRRFNARLSLKGYVWFWPKIAAALTSKHACDAQQRSRRSSAQGLAQMTGYSRGYYGGYYRRY